jgi:outer membrane protein assembly factor BamD
MRFILIAIMTFGAALFLFGCAEGLQGAEKYKNYSAPQLLAEGEKELSKHNYKDAAERFEAIDALYPFGKEAEQSDLDIIYAYYKAEDMDLAVAAADRFIHLYPQAEHTDYAYYMKGMMNFDRGRTWYLKSHPSGIERRDLTYIRQSFIDFNDLIKLFPHSVYVKDSYERMRYIRDLLAQNELDTANFYYDRKAYVAAANRANYVVKHFEGAPQVIDALKLMVKSYRAIGATDEANAALKVLQLNYPKEKI